MSEGYFRVLSPALEAEGCAPVTEGRASCLSLFHFPACSGPCDAHQHCPRRAAWGPWRGVPGGQPGGRGGEISTIHPLLFHVHLSNELLLPTLLLVI